MKVGFRFDIQSALTYLLLIEFEAISGDVKHVKCLVCSSVHKRVKIILRTGISGHRATQTHRDAQSNNITQGSANSTQSTSTTATPAQPALLSIADEFIVSDSEDKSMDVTPAHGIFDDIVMYGDEYTAQDGHEIRFVAGNVALDTPRDQVMRSWEAMEYADVPQFSIASSAVEIRGWDLDEEDTGGDATLSNVMTGFGAIRKQFCQLLSLKLF